MANRVLKERICESDSINRLSAEAEVFLYRLMVQADDYGRMDARPAILKAKCFPLRDVSAGDLAAWLEELARAEIVLPYEVDGRRFLHFPKWEEHQRIRNQRSRYPAPTGNPLSIDSKSRTTVSDSPADDSGPPSIAPTRAEINSNPIQSEYESNPNPKSTPMRAHEGAGASAREAETTTDPPAGTGYGATARALRELGVSVSSENPTLRAWVDEGLLRTPERIRECVEIARQYKAAPERIPANYLDRIVRQPPTPPPKANGKGTSSRDAERDRIAGEIWKPGSKGGTDGRQERDITGIAERLD